jgi:hypothetical protein
VLIVTVHAISEQRFQALENKILRAVIDKVGRDFTVTYNRKPGDLYSMCAVAGPCNLYGMVDL